MILTNFEFDDVEIWKKLTSVIGLWDSP